MLTGGIAILPAGAGLARGLWSNWQQTWLGIFLIKDALEFLGQMKLLNSYTWRLPKLKLGMVASISKAEKMGIREKQWLYASTSRLGPLASALCRSQKHKARLPVTPEVLDLLAHPPLQDA